MSAPIGSTSNNFGQPPIRKHSSSSDDSDDSTRSAHSGSSDDTTETPLLEGETLPAHDDSQDGLCNRAKRIISRLFWGTQVEDIVKDRLTFNEKSSSTDLIDINSSHDSKILISSDDSQSFGMEKLPSNPTQFLTTAKQSFCSAVREEAKNHPGTIAAIATGIIFATTGVSLGIYGVVKDGLGALIGGWGLAGTGIGIIEDAREFRQERIKAEATNQPFIPFETKSDFVRYAIKSRTFAYSLTGASLGWVIASGQLAESSLFQWQLANAALGATLANDINGTKLDRVWFGGHRLLGTPAFITLNILSAISRTAFPLNGQMAFAFFLSHLGGRAAYKNFCISIYNAYNAKLLPNSDPLSPEAIQDFLAMRRLGLNGRDLTTARFWGVRGPALLALIPGLVLFGVEAGNSFIADLYGFAALFGWGAFLGEMAKYGLYHQLYLRGNQGLGGKTVAVLTALSENMTVSLVSLGRAGANGVAIWPAIVGTIDLGACFGALRADGVRYGELRNIRTTLLKETKQIINFDPLTQNISNCACKAFNTPIIGSLLRNPVYWLSLPTSLVLTGISAYLGQTFPYNDSYYSATSFFAAAFGFSLLQLAILNAKITPRELAEESEERIATWRKIGRYLKELSLDHFGSMLAFSLGLTNFGGPFGESIGTIGQIGLAYSLSAALKYNGFKNIVPLKGSLQKEEIPEGSLGENPLIFGDGHFLYLGLEALLEN